MDTRQKKPYEKPALTVWGSLRDLTQSHFGSLDFKNGTTAEPPCPPEVCGVG
jgi:hypothetical protein